MTNNDLNQIGVLIDKKLSAVETGLKEEIVASSKRVKDDIGDFIENTLMPMINERFDAVDERLDAVDERLNAVDEGLDEKADKSDIDRLERKLDKIIDTS